MPTDAHRGEAGAALVEAAFVLPVLLALVFVIADASLYFWTAGLAAKAAQLGVRRAVVSDPVAVGPGLEREESEHYWDGLPPGTACFPAPDRPSPCPSFSVTCSRRDGCRCPAGACPYRFAAARLAPILAAMQAVLPDLGADNVAVSYTTNDLGYVARPPPVPVDVRVTIVGLRYTPLLLGALFRDVLPLRGSAELPSESLLTQ